MIEFPAVPPGEPLSISATLYTTFLRCPGQALANVQGTYGPDSRSSFSGMLAHRIFARHLNSGPVPHENFTSACREEIGQAMNPKLGSLQLRPSELRGVIAEVGVLYKRFQLVSTDGCLGVEEQLECNVGSGVVLRGRVDAVFDDSRGVRLVDWKTGSLGGAEDQLDFYALLWGLVRGELPAFVEAASVASGERHVTVPSMGSAADTARKLSGMIATLRGGFADPATVPLRGGPGCRYCPLHEECEEGVTALRVLSA